jgi:hypothetical protein
MRKLISQRYQGLVREASKYAIYNYHTHILFKEHVAIIIPYHNVLRPTIRNHCFYLKKTSFQQKQEISSYRIVSNYIKFCANFHGRPALESPAESIFSG